MWVFNQWVRLSPLAPPSCLLEWHERIQERAWACMYARSLQYKLYSAVYLRTLTAHTAVTRLGYNHFHMSFDILHLLSFTYFFYTMFLTIYCYARNNLPVSNSFILYTVCVCNNKHLFSRAALTIFFSLAEHLVLCRITLAVILTRWWVIEKCVQAINLLLQMGACY